MKPLVTAAILLSPTQPGRDAWLAVHYRIEPGWHLYWENPGESGLAPSAAITLPPGVTVGEPRFPGPHRFAMPGDMVNYGYSGEAALLFPLQIAPGAELTGTIAVETRWLVCQESQCVPGNASLILPLPPPPGPDLTARWVEKLPGPLPADAQVTRVGARVTVLLPDAVAGEVFPDLELEPALQEVRITPGARGLQLELLLRGDPAPGAGAVLRAETPAGERFYALDLRPAG